MEEKKKANIEVVKAVINTLSNLSFPIVAILAGDPAMTNVIGCCRALQGFVDDYTAEQEANASADSEEDGA
ncbi:MAG: hypothetical protein IJ418_02580 [Clostridia bacterium]|nr:hypothetical protein [Clostridia bacterium]